MLCDGNMHELAEALRVEWMKMTEPTTHGLLWELDEFPSMELQLTVETEARLPKRILDCKTVEREVGVHVITVSSAKQSCLDVLKVY